MKAKEVAQSINQAATQAGLDERWEELKRRIIAGESTESLRPFSHEVLQQAVSVTQATAQEYITFLSRELGAELAAKSGGKPESFRALVLAADQSWRAFHHRLNPASQHVLEVDALKIALQQHYPSVYRLGWEASGPVKPSSLGGPRG